MEKVKCVLRQADTKSVVVEKAQQVDCGGMKCG